MTVLPLCLCRSPSTSSALITATIVISSTGILTCNTADPNGVTLTTTGARMHWATVSLTLMLSVQATAGGQPCHRVLVRRSLARNLRQHLLQSARINAEPDVCRPVPGRLPYTFCFDCAPGEGITFETILFEGNEIKVQYMDALFGSGDAFRYPMPKGRPRPKRSQV